MWVQYVAILKLENLFWNVYMIPISTECFKTWYKLPADRKYWNKHLFVNKKMIKYENKNYSISRTLFLRYYN